jgi:hypothetical protein
MVEAIKSLSKEAEMMIHRGVLMRQRLSELQEANEAATRRKSHKIKRLQKQGTLTVEEGVRITTLNEFETRSDRKKAKKRARVVLRAGAIWAIRRSSSCEDLSRGRSRWLVNRVLNAASHSRITTFPSTFQLQHVEVGEPSQRRCGRCGEAEHNLRTCRQEVAIYFE